ncbi:bifunctional UDP-N-acetylglucosamine diphosphorylase/glucosamine-1-phosphate N-acetyltransferase GlmU [Chloroflexi bacterium TSY]|nr:bifunctional UDP-N-acetylglucosamine diphosphorylase/glucosamine-1-phosphate N-acetyltransferase GlmU [Chloroflexi bacterium TSY]
MNTAVVILAAGYGTRMKSDLPKVLHPICGRALVDWSTSVAEQVSTILPTVVVGHGREKVQALLGNRVQYVVQTELLGTGHAVKQTEVLLRKRTDDQQADSAQPDIVLVIYSDMPLLRSETLFALLLRFQSEREHTDVPIAMLTIVRDDPQGFGRIIRNQEQQIEAIIEEADCTPEQKQIRELNPGIYCFDAEWLWSNLDKIPLSTKGEYYLTDMIGIAVQQGKRICSVSANPEEVNGINTRVHLALASQVMRQRILEKLMLAGVTVVDPHSTYIDDTVQIGQDTTIMPGSILRGDTVVGQHCVIGPYSQICDSTIGNNCLINHSVVEGASIADECEVGPFGHLRKGAQLDHGVHMGNFGEVKNSYLGPGTKMGHFSYIGDAHLEDGVNIGAGTITCNYDGIEKHKTYIGKDTFVGSGTLLIAPVTIGNNANTGAGSVVTRDVAADTLVYGVPARPRSSQS